MTDKPKASSKYNWLAERRLIRWYLVEIVEYEDRKEVLFHSTIHKNMPVKLKFCFSTQFTDTQILHDREVLTKFIEHFPGDIFV